MEIQIHPKPSFVLEAQSLLKRRAVLLVVGIITT
jgi:hypothetical protein